MKHLLARIPAAAFLSVFASDAIAATTKSSHGSIETAGAVVAIALPLAAGAVSVSKDDWDGLAKLAVVTVATVGTSYALQHVTHEERPDMSDDHSFPSSTSALAFAPAQFLWNRYGWEYGLPAYAAAGFVGYSRVESQQHHWWDVAASAGISWGFNRWLTNRYYNPDIYGTASLMPGGGYVGVSYRF